MISVYVPDVGDGLAAGVQTMDGQHIQIDCGSQQHPDVAFKKGLCRIDPDAFFLSHFHVDHYNGLLQEGHPKIQQVFFPLVPKFPQNKQFLQSMLAMAQWAMGDKTGSMEADFLGILSKINSQPFTYRGLSSGDTIQVGSSRFEVLWPPPVMEDKGTLKLIRTAISDFEAAMKEDETLRRIYDEIGKRGTVHPYCDPESAAGERPGRGEEGRDREESRFPAEPRQFPKSTKKANDSLRRAANHLSLAFYQDKRLLFLGDLEGYEIRCAVKTLMKKGKQHFTVTITPHHGTHWQRDLERIHSWWVISSVGRKLFSHVAPEFKSMSEVHLITHLHGDVAVPVYLPPWYCPRFSRHWPLFL